MIKTGKKFILKSECGNFKIVLGAVINHANPRSVYFKITSWLSYNTSSIPVKSMTESIKKSVKTFLRDHPSYAQNFTYSMVVNSNVSETRVKAGQVTYFELDVTLFQRENENGLPLSSPKGKNVKNLKQIITPMFNELLNQEFIRKNKYVNFHFDKVNAKKVINEKTLEI